jgi:hypothetical protein
MLESAGCYELAAAGPSLFSLYTVKYAEGTEELSRLRSVLATKGISWTERREHGYSASELRSAPLLVVRVRSAEKGMGGPTYGTEYSLAHACVSCGTGAEQTSALVLNQKDLKKTGDLFQTLDHELLVSTEVHKVLSDGGITGCELRPIRVWRHDHASPGWFQLISRTRLPPMAPTSKGVLRENACPTCGQDGYFHDTINPLEIVYKAGEVNLDQLPDVMSTYEYFGNSRLTVPFSDSHFARSMMLVKPRVYEALVAIKVRGLDFVPVSMVP